MDNDVIGDGDTVVVQMNDADKISSIIHVTSKGEQKIGRSRLPVKRLIGACFGSIFQINNRSLEEVDDVDVSLEDSCGDPDESTGKGNNSNYADTNTAQKLCDDDIIHLKESGASGLDIIKTLIANSDTWSAKTEYAQEKWLKRKQKKYLPRFRIVKSTPASVCEVYHAKNKDKICGLRWDTLAQVLSCSGVRAGMRMLVVESTVGLVVGSVAYRMRGLGQILAVYPGQQPHFEIVGCLNLDEKSTGIIQPVPSCELGPAATDVCQHGYLAITPEYASSGDGESSMSCDQTACPEPGDVDSKTINYANRNTRSYNATGRHAADNVVLKRCLREGSNSLIIATKHHPLPILREALCLLYPSSPFVIHHEYLEPLVECYQYLQRTELGLRLLLTDTWTREYQTLPGRVHPQMFMSASGGYLLSGIYIGMTASLKTTMSPAMSPLTAPLEQAEDQ